jgi:hypothetical protein
MADVTGSVARGSPVGNVAATCVNHSGGREQRSIDGWKHGHWPWADANSLRAGRFDADHTTVRGLQGRHAIAALSDNGGEFVMPEEIKQTLWAFAVAMGGLLIAAVVTLVIYKFGMTDAKELIAVAGVFTGITGTLAGSFLGVHIGAAGKAKLQADRDDSATKLAKAMTKLTEDQRREVDPSWR